MSEDETQGCVAAAEGPIAPERDEESADPKEGRAREEAKRMQVMVGKEAPDFGATAYVDGGFANVKLSDHRGDWVFLCFYPGDFTFV